MRSPRSTLVLRGAASAATLLALYYLVSSSLRLQIISHQENGILPGGEEGPDSDTGSSFSWSKIVPKPALVWHKCYEEYQCARLIVPLDHANPNGRNASIALIRLPAELGRGANINADDANDADSDDADSDNADSDDANKNSDDALEYRGPILFNPGGPGAGGIDQILNRGKLFRSIVGPQFDLVGFDPRGLGASTPVISFFDTDAQRAQWDMVSSAPNATANGLGQASARALITGRLARQKDDGSLQYMNTEQTARDMMSIVRAYGREKLQYWGVSYGTVIGATFAMLYPDKIERLMLDGVIDAYNYYGGKSLEWSNTLEDTDKVTDLFLAECTKAGRDACAFAERTPSQTALKLRRLFDTLQTTPLPVFTETEGYGIIDRDAIRMVVFKLLKGPYRWFQPMAQGLQDLVEGDGAWALRMFKQLVRGDFECIDSCLPADSPMQDRVVLDDGGVGILCNDYKQILDAGVWAEEYYAKLTKGSSWGDVWSRYLLGCQHWPLYDKSAVRGPFNANTSHPVLLLSNRLDPVAPLSAAKTMSKGFSGSVVLVQEAAGHASTVVSSPCTHGYIKDYFVKGTLPAPGTRCHDVDIPFFPKSTLFRSTEAQQEAFALSTSMDRV